MGKGSGKCYCCEQVTEVVRLEWVEGKYPHYTYRGTAQVCGPCCESAGIVFQDTMIFHHEWLKILGRRKELEGTHSGKM